MRKTYNEKRRIYTYNKISITTVIIIGSVFSYCFFSEINIGSAKDVTTFDVNNLFINELMADNDITIPGPYVDYPDWIELYNSGTEQINLSGMFLTDDLNDPTKWQFPNNTIIDSKEYLLIWSDGYNSSNEVIYTSFKLNANGDTVALFASDGVTLIDSVTFKKQIRDTSYGRLPDAGDDWEYLSDPTPGWSNGEGLSNEKIPIWVLPILMILVILVIIAVIAIRKILIWRDFR